MGTRENATDGEDHIDCGFLHNKGIWGLIRRGGTFSTVRNATTCRTRNPYFVVRGASWLFDNMGLMLLPHL